MSAIEPTLAGPGLRERHGPCWVSAWACSRRSWGNVVQSSVDASGRSEAGGLQYTSQQLGSAVGVALVGAVVIAGLSASFVSIVQRRRAHPDRGRGRGDGGDERHGADMVASEDLAAVALSDTDLDSRGRRTALVEDYEAAQLQALQAAGCWWPPAVALLALMFTRELPNKKPGSRCWQRPVDATGMWRRTTTARMDPPRDPGPAPGAGEVDEDSRPSRRLDR